MIVIECSNYTLITNEPTKIGHIQKYFDDDFISLLDLGRAGAACAKLEDVVARLGAVQAQDYAGVKWVVGQRVQGATDTTIDQAFNQGAILRPTWHFVIPADTRCLLNNRLIENVSYLLPSHPIPKKGEQFH